MLGAPACQLFRQLELPGRAHDHSQVIADQTCINFFLWVSEKSLYIGQPVQRLSPATSAGTATELEAGKAEHSARRRRISTAASESDPGRAGGSCCGESPTRTNLKARVRVGRDGPGSDSMMMPGPVTVRRPERSRLAASGPVTVEPPSRGTGRPRSRGQGRAATSGRCRRRRRHESSSVSPCRAAAAQKSPGCNMPPRSRTCLRVAGRGMRWCRAATCLRAEHSVRRRFPQQSPSRAGPGRWHGATLTRTPNFFCRPQGLTPICPC